MKKLGYAVLTAVMAGGLALSAATPASAGHCENDEGTSPGFSYFGTTPVQNADHNGEEAGQPEGGQNGPHAGTPGASNCRETAGSPDRSPNK